MWGQKRACAVHPMAEAVPDGRPHSLTRKRAFGRLLLCALCLTPSVSHCVLLRLCCPAGRAVGPRGRVQHHQDGKCEGHHCLHTQPPAAQQPRAAACTAGEWRGPTDHPQRCTVHVWERLSSKSFIHSFVHVQPVAVTPKGIKLAIQVFTLCVAEEPSLPCVLACI